MTKIKNISQLITIISFCLILFGIILAAWFFLHNDLVFHTDIARDFLLLEDIVHNKPITLIGPRAGGIPGVFHGPLWLYMNIPAFIIGHGNPVIVGWGWFTYFIASIVGMWFVAKKLFDNNVALLSTILYTFVTAGLIKESFNPTAAVYLTPIFFYFFYKYVKENKPLFLSLTYFLLGLIIQLQMAFGVPLTIISTAIVVFHIFKERKFVHFLYAGTIIIPLSTYILFEVKHNFLQVRSVINFLTGVENAGKLKIQIGLFLLNRIQGFFFSGISYITGNIILVSGIVISLIVGVFISKNKTDNDRLIYFLFAACYGGFWASTLIFKGVIWSYYYWPLTPLIIIVISSAYKLINKKLFLVAYAIILGLTMFNLTKDTLNATSYIGTGKTGGTWQYYYKPAQDIFMKAPHEFGYYIYTSDQYGYSSRYAMNFSQTQFIQKKAAPFEKKQTTYLFIFPSKGTPYTDENWWRAHQVAITKKPAFIHRYNKDFYTEEYNLSTEEQAVQSDPNLLHSIIFR